MFHTTTFRKLTLVSMSVGIIFCIFVFSTSYLIQKQFEKHTADLVPFYELPGKVWGHSGYYVDAPRNSLEALEAALDLGATGIEIDIFYDSQLNDFVISYDEPYEKFNGKILKLDEAFMKLGTRGFYWLDFKNLGSLKPSNVERASKRLSLILSQRKLEKKIIIESKSHPNLAQFSKLNIPTLYAPSLYHDAPIPVRWYRMLEIKYLIAKYNFSALSFDHNYFDPTLLKTFHGMDIYLYTINDEKKLKTLLDIPDIKVILTDKHFFNQNAKTTTNSATQLTHTP